MENDFSGEIVVASRIVDYLSSGLYESPSACLKELINNSYDADATQVDLFVKPDADRIIIADNGHGMNRADFERHFSRISESFKRESNETTDLGRPKIGKIGIGFIAANEICDVMEIVSTRAGSRELLNVEIRFDVMRSPTVERRRKENELSKADYSGSVAITSEEDHFTHIFLKDIKGEAKQILLHAGSTEFTSGEVSVYGKTLTSVLELIRNENVRSWSDFDPYSKNILEIGLNVPVAYHKDWMPSPLDSEVNEFTEVTQDLNFLVNVDGGEVRKPIAFSGGGKAFVSRFDFSGKYVEAHGYFYVQHGSIRPQELRGLLLRIRHAAVGEYDPSFLGFSPSRSSLIQGWISSEIWADDRLEDAMNIDRRTLRVAHPSYVELQQAVHKHLAGVLSEARSSIYGAGSDDRKLAQARDIRTNILRIVEDAELKLPAAVSRKLSDDWSSFKADKAGRKVLLKKYKVDELYELVMSVASETLQPNELKRFMDALTKRIGNR